MSAQKQFVMPEDERDAECSALASEAAQFIVGKLAGTRGTEFRGLSSLEGDIYSWLWDHAIFEDETEDG